MVHSSAGFQEKKELHGLSTEKKKRGIEHLDDLDSTSAEGTPRKSDKPTLIAPPSVLRVTPLAHTVLCAQPNPYDNKSHRGARSWHAQGNRLAFNPSAKQTLLEYARDPVGRPSKKQKKANGAFHEIEESSEAASSVKLVNSKFYGERDEIVGNGVSSTNGRAAVPSHVSASTTQNNTAGSYSLTRTGQASQHDMSTPFPLNRKSEVINLTKNEDIGQPVMRSSVSHDEIELTDKSTSSHLQLHEQLDEQLEVEKPGPNHPFRTREPPIASSSCSIAADGPSTMRVREKYSPTVPGQSLGTQAMESSPLSEPPPEYEIDDIEDADALVGPLLMSTSHDFETTVFTSEEIVNSWRDAFSDKQRSREKGYVRGQDKGEGTKVL
ncbi:hypothetical protein DFH11DRAFT_204710 [Phellopilus nigrolimitatus]|nr:hypothetical protein DFH11DRAFT_204710 [Phellopilus nigrolimitatus]